MKELKYDFTTVGKKTLDKNKRIEEQTNTYLSEHYKEAREAENAKINETNIKNSSAARFGFASNLARAKNRSIAMNEEIEYANSSSTIGMTEMLSTVVENSLLLDESEFAAIHPSYKTDIKDTIRGFLENSELNSNITNKSTLALMEYVAKHMPASDLARSLNESELLSVFNKEEPSREIKQAIEDLSGDTKEKVISLIGDENKRIEDISTDIADISALADDGRAVQAALDPSSAAVPTSAPSPIQAPIASDGSSDDGAPLASDGSSDDGSIEAQDIGVQESFDSVTGAVLNSDGLTNAEAEIIRLAQSKKDAKVDDPTTEFSGDPADIDFGLATSSIDLDTDRLNTVVNESKRNKFVSDTKRQGLLESLAANEAEKMISEGRGYNGDLALGNAILYVTILETLESAGLINLTTAKKNQIITAAGGLTEKNVSAASNIAAKDDLGYKLGYKTPEEKRKEQKDKDAAAEKSRKERKAYTQYIKAKDSGKFNGGWKDWGKAGKPALVHEDKETFSREEIVNLLEDEGFDFNIDIFEDVAYSWNYTKTSDGRYYKK